MIVIEENKSFSQIIGNKDGPWINELAKRGALFTQSYGVTHPSQPNYLALFSGSIAQGDAWLKKNIEGYARWAMTHNSLLIVTYDEDDGSEGNCIATIFVGQRIKPGRYRQRINHYNLLRTVEDMYGLPYLGESVRAQAVTGVWK